MPAIAPLEDAAGLQVRMDTVLTRSDFESAVKDALRHYTRTDLLAGNALSHAQLLMRDGPSPPTP